LESVSIYRQLDEPINAAAAEAIASEDYDFLGRPDQARLHGRSALHATGIDDRYRARVILSAMCRTELGRS
jgi:hypothetical protein